MARCDTQAKRNITAGYRNDEQVGTNLAFSRLTADQSSAFIPVCHPGPAARETS